MWHSLKWMSQEKQKLKIPVNETISNRQWQVHLHFRCGNRKTQQQKRISFECAHENCIHFFLSLSLENRSCVAFSCGNDKVHCITRARAHVARANSDWKNMQHFRCAACASSRTTVVRDLSFDSSMSKLTRKQKPSEKNIIEMKSQECRAKERRDGREKMTNIYSFFYRLLPFFFFCRFLSILFSLYFPVSLIFIPLWCLRQRCSNELDTFIIVDLWMLTNVNILGEKETEKRQKRNCN